MIRELASDNVSWHYYTKLQNSKSVAAAAAAAVCSSRSTVVVVVAAAVLSVAVEGDIHFFIHVHV